MMARQARTAVVVVALLVGAIGCAGAPASAPSTPPDIAGQVTAVDPSGERIGTIRVEASPGERAGSAKAMIRVGTATVVIGPDHRREDFAALAVGQSVRVWFSGPVLESYPVRAGAATIAIDTATR